MKRDKTIDAMKGILIFLVVAAHAFAPGHRFIYLFHMASFFMISGFLWKDSSLQISLKNFLKKKTKTLYLPYTCKIFVCHSFSKNTVMQ
ncbi:MAG: acyltransferase family protein [Lachnospiraceae bacterium]|nr:acyltransferase family protein [Lachnospiraceae bacterium]